MRKLTLIFAAVLLLSQSLLATVDNDYPERNTINPPYAIMRGVVNLCTFWLEYPRCLVYDYDRMSPMGIFLFPFTGNTSGRCPGTPTRARTSLPKKAKPSLPWISTNCRKTTSTACFNFNQRET